MTSYDEWAHRDLGSIPLLILISGHLSTPVCTFSGPRGYGKDSRLRILTSAQFDLPDLALDSLAHFSFRGDLEGTWPFAP